MRTRYAVGLAALLVAAAFCGAYAASHAPAHATAESAPADLTNSAPADAAAAPAGEAEPAPFQSPFPDRTCAGVPSDAKCCLWQVFKQGNGERNATYPVNYNCDTGTTFRGTMTMKVSLNSPGAACDQNAALIPNGSVLEAKGRVIARKDGFGDFIGDFVIRNPAGATLFSGCIETLDRVGTHRSCEQCNPTSHYEGLMTGRGAGNLANFSIRASIGARGELPLPGALSKATAIDINGALIKCP
ncbi:MAG TPA: hypothetical protein VNZ44_16405 [Pyrinomonadaceae bacterium]|nr:hypothetical protein [Pyrinomonadaceae bacterium]